MMPDTVKLGKRRYVSRLKPLSGWPPATALVDVLFLTLLFFCVGALFVRVSGIQVELPAVQPIAMKNMERYVIGVRLSPENRDGYQLYFDDCKIDQNHWDKLREKLNEKRGASEHPSVILYADKRIPSEVIARLMSDSEKAGFSTFWVVATPDREESPVLIK